jgi:hypothetical protein
MKQGAKVRKIGEKKEDYFSTPSSLCRHRI